MKKVIYHGERVSMLGNITQVFKDQKGREYGFKGIKNVWVGSCYELLKGDQMSVRPNELEPKGFELTEKEKILSDANRAAVIATRLRKRKAMELQRPNKMITQAVDLLRPFYQSLSRFDRERFMDYISNECSKKKKKK